MISIRGNFFYTRTVPCELWMFDKAKAPEHADKVLMLDARQVFRKVTRKVFDFSPEQLQNLSSIFWLYRGQDERFRMLVASYLCRSLAEADDSLPLESGFVAALEAVLEGAEDDAGLVEAAALFKADWSAFTERVKGQVGGGLDIAVLHARYEALEPLADQSRDLVKQVDQLFKLAEKAHRDGGGKRGRANPVKGLDTARLQLVDQLKWVRYFHRQAHWLLSRFPEARLAAVPGLVRLVDRADLALNDWSLTPGRYVGVAPEEEDEDFDFEAVMRDIHVELAGLNHEAAGLAVQIQSNFDGLGL